MLIAAKGPLIQSNQQWLKRFWLNQNVKIVNMYSLLIKIFSQIYISIYIYLSSPLFFSTLSPFNPNFLLIYILLFFSLSFFTPLIFYSFLPPLPPPPLVMLKLFIFPSELFYWPNLVKNQQLNLSNRCLSSQF